MKNELEEFVKKNRDAFDDREIPEAAWENIERSLRFDKGFSKKGLWNSVVLWRAAAIVFMAISGYLLIPKDKLSDKTKASSEMAVTEFMDVENFYFKQISEKVALIDEFQRGEGLNGFTHDFQQLEAMYMVLKEEMKTSPSQKVKDALVLNLLVRIDLLNQRLHKLEKEGDKGKGRKDREV
jgi:hypothetical protein